MLQIIRRAIPALMLVACFCLTLFVGSHAYATGVTLPDTGIDVSDYVDALVTQMGTVVATCVGAVFAFLAIRKGIRWVRGV